MHVSPGQNKAQQKIIKKLQQAIDYINANQLNQARTLCRQLTRTHPKLADAWHMLALVEKQDGQIKPAIYAFEKAITLNPRQADYLYNLAVTYHQSGESDLAITFYKRCLQCYPKHAAALDNLGVLYQQKLDFLQAKQCHQQAVAIQATPSNLNNLGECFRNIGEAEEALSAYQQALQLEPRFINALKNMGNLYKELGQFDKAEQCLQAAVEIEKQQAGHLGTSEADAAWNQATFLLLQGRFQQGWLKYESGIQQGTRTFVDYGYPIWKGQSGNRTTLFIIGEQGIGDEIMFASCFENAIDTFRQVIIECDTRLVPIFKRTFPKAVVLDRNDESAIHDIKQTGQIDCQIPAGSLPGIFRQHQDNFPQATSFLNANQTFVRHWQQTLNALGSRLKVGIAWRGGREPLTIHKRSTSLSMWQPLFNLPDITFINLQYGDCRAEIAWVKEHLNQDILSFDDIDPLTELDNYAALIASLDLIISIDNSVVHLAGALGKPTWVMLPYVPDWRWQMDTDKSIWYPSIRLFRQIKKDEWSPVFARVCDQLKQVSQVEQEPSRQKNEIEQRQTMQKRLLLINDTSSWYHWGCTCTSQGLLNQFNTMGYLTDSIPIQDCFERVYLPNKVSDCDSTTFQSAFIDNNSDLFDKIQSSDVIVLNGEGSLHGESPLALTLLLLMKLAKQRFQKSVHIINHSCYPDDKTTLTDSPITQFYQRVYQRMDSVAIRETISAALVSAMGIKVTQSFDCLPLYLQQNPLQSTASGGNTIVISGSVALSAQAIEQLIRLTEILDQRGLKIVVLTGARAYPAREDTFLVERFKQRLKCSWQWIDAKSAEEWLQVIAEARLLISGRFHYSIAAASLKTPFIALTSNTAKMKGMLSMLQLPDPIAFEQPDLADRLSDEVAFVLENPQTRVVTDDCFAKMNQLAMQNFTALAELNG